MGLSADGTILAVGAPENFSNGTKKGCMRVFAYDSENGQWNQLGEDLHGEESNDYFGWSVGLSASGRIMAGGGYLNGGNGVWSGQV